MMRLPWYGKTVPHGVLDILRGCNCRCAACYNAAREVECKTLERLKEELAVLRAHRNLKAVSLSGGEPLMHPQVLDIVRWLTDEGLVAASLTNGILFTDEMAAKLADAGLRMISLHIQNGQSRADVRNGDFRGLLREKGEIARRHGIFPAMVETVRADDHDGFCEIARFFRETPAFEYALVTVAGDFAEIRSDVAHPDVPVETMLAALDAEGFSPAVFVGGRYRREVPRWYIFQSVQAIDRNGREMAWNRTRPGLVERAFLWGYALLCRKSLHWVPTTSAKLKARLVVNGLAGGRLSTFFFALRAIVRGWSVLEKHIIVQLPPHSLGDGRIECCDNCPDATVRNGRLHPVCLGDIGEEAPL